jgi:hypothetical protein
MESLPPKSRNQGRAIDFIANSYKDQILTSSPQE